MEEKKVKCGECHYYIPVYEKSGYCRRYPPMIKNTYSGNQTPVDYGHWCGEFKRKPVEESNKAHDIAARQLEEEVVRAGINYVNALDGKHESPFTPIDFLVTLKDQIRKVMQLRFGK